MTWNVAVVELVRQRARPRRLSALGETPTRTRVYQGDTLIHDNVHSSDMQWEPVPAGNLPYRVVHDASRPASVFRLSTRTHTEWTFISDTIDSDYFEDFSVLQLDYDLETNLCGNVRAGSRTRDRLQAGAVTRRHAATEKVTKVTLDISLRRWHHLAEGRL